MVAQFGFGSLAIKICTRDLTGNLTIGIGSKFAIGQILTGVILSFFALASKFNETSIILVVSLGLLPAYFALQPIVKHFEHLKRSRKYPLKGNLFVPTVIILIVSEQFIRLISRPISDALAYYLVQPKLIALTNGMSSLNGYESFLQGSAVIEVNNASVFIFAGEIGIRAYILISGIMLFRAVWEICHQLALTRLSAKLVLFLMATSTFLTNTLADGKTDNVSTLWFIAAFSILISSSNLSENRLLFLFGVILGFSTLSKISFIMIFPALVFYFLSQRRGKSRRRICLTSVYVIMGLSFPIVFNALKNLIVFSDPLAPFVSVYTEQDNQLFSQEWFSPEDTKWIIMSYPIALLFGQYPMQYGNLSPFIFLGIPILYSIRSLNQPEKKTIANLGIMGSITIILWVVIKPSILAPRYIGPAYIFLLIALGCLASKNIENIRSIKIKKVIAILVIGHLSLLSALSVARNDTRFYFGSKSPESLMYAHLAKASGGSGYIYLNTYNSSMLDSVSLQCSSVIHPFTLKSDLTVGVSVWEELYKEGFRFVVVDKSTHKSLDSEKVRSRVESSLISVKAIDFSDIHTLYTITSVEIDPKLKNGLC